MNGRLFLDTNILVYAYDAGAPEKQTVAVTYGQELTHPATVN